MRNCANPSCRAPLTACFGFVLAGDLELAMNHQLDVSEIRELCGACCLMLDGIARKAHAFLRPSASVPVDIRTVPCRFNHGADAVARYAVPQGCACFHDDRMQDLCAQHAAKAEPLGDMTVAIIYDPPMWRLMNIGITTRTAA